MISIVQHHKQLLINLFIAACIQLVYYLFPDQPSLDIPWEVDYFRGSLLLALLVFGMVGGIVEARELRSYTLGGGLWFGLSFLAVAGHIIVWAAGLRYFGVDVFAGEEANFLSLAGPLFFTFFFLFEFLYGVTGVKRPREEYRRVWGWSDILLTVYAAMCSAYVWDVLMGQMIYRFENWPHFILAELLPSILVFMLIILPFKRYFILERQLLAKSRKQEVVFVASYLLVIFSAVFPRVMEVFK